jgi:hypothetical protein
MLYHIVYKIETNPITQVIICVDEANLQKFVKGYKVGSEEFFHDGKLFLAKKIIEIDIYDSKFWPDHLRTSEGLKKYLELVRQGSNKINLDSLVEEISKNGRNCTKEYIKDKWGIESKIMEQEEVLRSINKDKIFISHSSKDKEIVNAFVEIILILGLELKRSNIFSTSLDGLDVKSGEDFKQRIKRELIEAKVVIQMLSKNYRSSEVCLNEMGAAWVLCDRVIPFVFKDMDYDVGFIHSNNQQLQIDNKQHLLKFYDDNKDVFVPDINSGNLNKQIDKFIREIS